MNIRPLIGVSWGNLIISIFIIMGILYLGIKFIRSIVRIKSR